MLGLVNGVYLCNQGGVDEINDRISERNIPSTSLQPQYGIRPVSTKYGYMQVLDQYRKPSINLEKYKTYSTNNVFNPGNAQAPWAGFANNVNTESDLRNQFFALQKCEQSCFVPSSNSDLYKTTVSYKPQTQTHPLLFDKPEFSPFNPNTLSCKENVFNNSTVQCVKDGPICISEK
jgi:hypothetical protein